MKNILFLLFTLPSLFAGNGPIKPNTQTEPYLVLELGSPPKSLIDSLSTDADLCCVYEFCQSDLLEPGTTIIRHKQTGLVLGTIYGVPSKTFLNMLLDDVFTTESLNDIVSLNVTELE